CSSPSRSLRSFYSFCVHRVLHSFPTRRSSDLNKRGVESPLSFVDEGPLYSLSSARSYGTASPNAASNSPVEPSGLFPHGLENPPFSNALVPVAADGSALE